ncbi:MAG: chorismate-binding protein [Parachlamydiaceae bacterium]|nr:chorismate-binding protein [Parachlamydiaceae bacterium]
MKKKMLANGSLMTIGTNRLLIGYGERTWLKEPDFKQPCFYFPDFFLKDTSPWCVHESYLETSVDALLMQLADCKGSTIVWKNTSKNVFEKAFGDLRQRFNKGELQKAVPFVFETSTEKMTPELLKHCLASALNYAHTHDVYLYGFWDQEQGMLGVTPEMLFRYEKNGENILETMACAGTYRTEQGSTQQLLNDSKELSEHQLVVAGIEEALQPFGSVAIDPMRILSLPGLAHLVTPMRAKLSTDVAFESIVRALHPTPALGASPKEPGMEWLKQYQTLINRERFGAPVGSVCKGANMNCVVGIRNVQWNAEGMKIGAGCGVVPESQLENEWQEIEAKLQSVKGILGL